MTSLFSFVRDRLFNGALVAALVGIGGTACGLPPLSQSARQLLEERVAAATTEPVYVGLVTSVSPKIEDTLYEYERRADENVISHITRTTEGEPVVWQGVRTHSDGTAVEMELIHAQLGLVAIATIEEDQVTLKSTVGEGKEEVATFATTGAVLVGPTLFQFLLDHRDRLDAGLEFDFLSIENRGVFRFVANAGAEPGVFLVRPVDPLVALVVSPLVIKHDADTGQMKSYQGPVPPLLEDGQTFEGLVHYVAEGPFR